MIASNVIPRGAVATRGLSECTTRAPLMKTYYVYIVASKSGVLYVGVTNDLERRIAEHKAKLVPGFTAKYNCDRLVWFEEFASVNDAIAAEKRIKGWRREKKIALIAETNPAMVDLMVATGEIQTESNTVISRYSEGSRS
ncbi:MAG: putative endonuclease [Phycisphaerales bacterium]|jgi:putative endonuclease|nr:putative endonuclease [Phycisphaerales bacterium]